MSTNSSPTGPIGGLFSRSSSEGNTTNVAGLSHEPQGEKDATPPPQPFTARLGLLVATLAGAGFLNILSVQSAVIMLPSIGKALNIPPSRQQWITSSYSVAFGCVLLLWARLADIFGRRTIFLIGSVSITLVTISVPFSPNEIVFNVLRALQGVSGAATVPSAIGILGASFPPGNQKNFAFVTYTATSALGSVLGNLAGGLIGSKLDWRWIFWIIAVVSAVVTTSGFIIIPLPRRRANNDLAPARPDVDWLGGALISSTLVLLLFGLTEGTSSGWKQPLGPACIGASVPLGIAFCFWQIYLERNTSRSPLMRLSMFKNKQFSAAFLIIGCFFASYNSYLIFATFYYQDFLGLSASDTTLRFIPAGVAGFLVAFATARLLAIFPGFYILIFSTICGTISPLLFALPIPPDTSYWAWGFPAMCLCISADTLSPTISLFVIQQLSQDDQSLGGGLTTTSNQLGRSLGVAIATTVQLAVGNPQSVEQGPGNSRMLAGLRAAEWVNTSLAASTLVLVLLFLRGTRHIKPKR